MKPQLLNLNSEALMDFRVSFDTALNTLIKSMIEKDLMTGEVGGKIKIEIWKKTDKETGEIFLMPEIKPDVHLKVGTKGKIDCGTVSGIILKETPGGRHVVSSNQITIDDLMKADGLKAKGA